MMKPTKGQSTKPRGPSAGLWYSKSFGLQGDGRIVPSFDYETRPMFDEQPAELSEARADISRPASRTMGAGVVGNDVICPLRIPPRCHAGRTDPRARSSR